MASNLAEEMSSEALTCRKAGAYVVLSHPTDVRYMTVKGHPLIKHNPFSLTDVDRGAGDDVIVT